MYDSTETLFRRITSSQKFWNLGMSIICSLLAAGVGLAISGEALLASCVVVGAIVLLSGAALLMAKPERIPYAVVCAALILVSANGLRRGSLTFADGLLVIGLVFTFYGWISQRFKIPPWWLAGFLLLSLSIGITEVFAVPEYQKNGYIFESRNLGTGQMDDSPGWQLGVRLLVAACVMPIVIAALCSSLKRVHLAISLWLVGTAVSSIIGLLAAFSSLDLQEAITGAQYGTVQHGGTAGRFVGLAVHPTIFGVMAALTFAVALARITNRRTAWKYGPLVGIYAGAVLVSGSRAALAGIIAAFAVTYCYQLRSRKYLAGLVATGCAVGLWKMEALSGSISVIQRITGSDTKAAAGAEISNTARQSAMSDAWGYFLERPFSGWGFDAIKGAHNTVLQLLSSGGVIALMGWGLLVVGALHLGWQLYRSLPEPYNHDAFGLINSIVVIFIGGMSMNIILDRWLYVPVGLMLGLHLAVQRMEAQARSPARKSWQLVTAKPAPA